MTSKSRKLGLKILPRVNWGSHICQFYDSKQDLLDILVLYFKAGLENNESCLWILSSLTLQEAKEALVKGVPDLTRYLECGQMEFVAHTELCFQDGAFNPQAAVDVVAGKLSQALGRGYDGLRVTGDLTWLDKKNFSRFVTFEKQAKKYLLSLNSIALCTHPLNKGIMPVIAFAGIHDRILVKQDGKLAILESSVCKKMGEILRVQNEIATGLGAGVIVTRVNDSTTVFANRRFGEMFGYEPDELVGKSVKELNVINDKGMDEQSEEIREYLRKNGTWHGEIHTMKKDGTRLWCQVSITSVDFPIYGVLRIGIHQDITEYKVDVERQELALVSRQGRVLTPVQERFIYSGLQGMSDQEAIELVLGLTMPAKNARRMARECIRVFHTLSGFLVAEPRKLRELGIARKCILWIKLMHELPLKILKQRIMEQPTYKSSRELFNYLYYSMRDLEKEVFKVIYLNARGQIIDTTDLFQGVRDSIPISPREIMEKTLSHEATELVFVHNHPSGDPTPSNPDKQLTRDLVFVGHLLQVKVLDHIIIGQNRYYSFAGEGLIEEYELDFLNMKIRSTSEAKRRLYTAKRDLLLGYANDPHRRKK